MAEDVTVYVKEGVVSNPAEPNKNPSPAQAQNQQSTFSTAVKTLALAQAAKQTINSTISQIGFATGNYQLQETAEAVVSGIGLGVALYAAPIPAAVGLTIKTGFDVWATGVRQRRAQYGQQQQQILTGKISVNGGRY